MKIWAFLPFSITQEPIKHFLLDNFTVLVMPINGTIPTRPRPITHLHAWPFIYIFYWTPFNGSYTWSHEIVLPGHLQVNLQINCYTLKGHYILQDKLNYDLTPGTRIFTDPYFTVRHTEINMKYLFKKHREPYNENAHCIYTMKNRNDTQINWYNKERRHDMCM